MATTYKFRATGTETLTAQIFADDIEIHSSHRLSPCTTYQWHYDDLLGTDGGQPIDSATNPTYDVDLSSVGNSGEYYCVITVGSCAYTTERRRITIIGTISPDSILFTDAGGTAEIVIEAPHYETVLFSDEGSTFISPDDAVITCTTPMMNVCRFVQTITVDPTTDKSQPREAQVSMTVGSAVLFFGIGQDRNTAQAPSTTERKGPDGPFINLADNGPTTAGGTITVTATVGTIGDDASPYTVTWPDGSSGATFDVTRATAGTETVMATVGDTNGLTATESITLTWTMAIIPSPTGLTTITGAQFPRVDWNIFQFGNPTVMPGVRMVDAFFGVEGAGRWQYTVSFNQGFFGTPVETGRVRFTVSGPGVNSTTTVSVGEAPVTVEFPAGTTGTYRYQLDIDVDDEGGQLIVYPSGSVSLLPINF